MENEYNAEVRQTTKMEDLTIPIEETLKLAEKHEGEKDEQG